MHTPHKTVRRHQRFRFTLVCLSNQNQIKYLLLMTDKRNHSSWKKTQEKNGDTHNTYKHNKLS